MIQKLTKMLPSDVAPGVLETELEVFIIKLKNGRTNKIEHFAYKQSKTLPLTWQAYQLMLTAPISVSIDASLENCIDCIFLVALISCLDFRLLFHWSPLTLFLWEGV